MRVLCCCEMSGIVRNAFSSLGHYAVSVDFKHSLSPGNHVIGDCLPLLYQEEWDLVIAFPPCTYLCKAQLWRCVPGSYYYTMQLQAIEFFKSIWHCPQKRIVIENPIGILSTVFRPPDQIIYPWWFGNPHKKDICLWLKGVPPLIATCYSTKRISVSNHVNSRMSPAKKSEIKSLFFPEIAVAMSTQWSEKFLLG